MLTQQTSVSFEPYKAVLIRIAEFLYAIAHGIGNVVVGLLHVIVPVVKVPQDLTDLIGVMVIATALAVMAEVVRKLTWFVLAAGWLLVALRIVLALVSGGAQT